MRCVDYLESLPQVDKSQIGCAGLSLGGEMVMWLAAMDERLQAAASCGFLTVMDHIQQHGCPCWNFPGLRQLVDFADIYALIAPRSLECQNGQKEPPTDFTPELASRAMAEIRPVYAAFDCAQKPILDIHGGAHEVDLPALLAFFDQSLKGSNATNSGRPLPLSPAKSSSTKPMPRRIISFHRAYPNGASPEQGSVSKEIIQRAANLGYNGVQFMFVGDTVKDLERFAQYDAKEKTVDFCHRQGMKVALWVHELSGLPKPGAPGDLGPIAVDNEKLWAYLDRRYERILGQLLPDIDGLVLTVVETQIRVTEPRLMSRLALLLRDKCRKYGKELIVRTFVWYPSELEGLMACVRQLPDDVVIMTKCVVQDWQMRGLHDAVIGNVGNHQQIIEYDVAGEYFLLDAVANCMPDVLKGYFDYDRAHGAAGIVVRADRFHSGSEVTDQPQEVNLWALGLWASGKADSVDEVWQAWATQRYGPEAAPGIIRALKPASQVLTECLNVGPFTFGDTRSLLPPNGDVDAFAGNWQNWRWDASYEPLYRRTLNGDPLIIQQTEKQKAEALKTAQGCLAELDRVQLDPPDYEILKTRLSNHKVQLEYRAPMMLAYLRYRRILKTQDVEEKKRLAIEIRKDLEQVRAVANRKYPLMKEIDYRGRKWRVGAPDFVNSKGKPAMDWNVVRTWADKMESLLAQNGVR